MALSANLCAVFEDAGAQEYAANQVREETRHVRALSRYIGERWGAPSTAGSRITELMSGLVTTAQVHRKIVGMQIMIEGLALGVMAAMQSATADPVLKRLLRLMMADAMMATAWRPSTRLLSNPGFKAVGVGRTLSCSPLRSTVRWRPARIGFVSTPRSRIGRCSHPTPASTP